MMFEIRGFFCLDCAFSGIIAHSEVGQFWLYFDFYALRRSERVIIPENVCLHLKVLRLK